MSIVIANGSTITLNGGETLDSSSKDVNKESFTVQGTGTLNLGHDANGATIRIVGAGATVNIAHDLNGNATVYDDGGTITVGHDANSADFFISNGGEVVLSHGYNASTFALSGQNDKVIFGDNNNPVSGKSLKNQITGLDVGDRIELAGQSFSSAIFSGGTITLSNGFKLTNVSFAPGVATRLVTGIDPTTGFYYLQVAYVGRTISTTTAGPVLLQSAILDNPLTVTATGKATSSGANADGIDGTTAAAWTIVNDGTVFSAGGIGISLAGAGIVSNGRMGGAAVISGSVAGIEIDGSGTVTNYGRISAAGAGSAGVNLAAGGSVTNNSGGSISGGTNGIVLGAAGSVTNAAGAAIAGGTHGILVNSAPGTVVNAGSIGAMGANGTGTYMRDGGIVTNNAPGSISGAVFGVFLENAAGIVVNGGTIAGGTDGVVLGTGGSVLNAAGASVTGGSVGVYAKYRASGTVTNSGIISATAPSSAGVDLALGGIVTNNAGATVLGGSFGIFVTGAAGTVVNAGSIAGPGNIGVDLLAGGSVTNLAGASISSGGTGVAVYGGGGTVTNAGTISGVFRAVDFGNSGSNRLVVLPGAVFNGTVAAGSGVNTLELARGAAAGSIGGIGTGFTGFGPVSVDAGANWTLTGNNTAGTVLNNGTLAIGDGASLGVTVSVDLASTGLFVLGSNALLEIAADTGSGNQIAFLGPSSMIIDTASQFGANVGQSNYTGPLIESFGPGDRIDLMDVVPTGLTLNYASSTGLLQVVSGTTNVASLRFQNSSLGSGSFQVTDDGSGHALITHG